MEEHSEKELEQVCNKADKWFTKFSKSPYFQNLTEEQKEASGSIISMFTEYMYNYHGRTPEEWDKRALESCCLETLPKKITADEAYFRSLAPVLSAFLGFTEKEELLKNSSDLAKAVQAIDKQIVETSNDPSSWGMAKSFMMSAKKNGVNLEDKKELNEYVIAYNSRLLESRQAQSKRSKIGRNDPCSCGSGKKYKKCCGR